MEVIYNLLGDLLPEGTFLSLRMVLLVLMVSLLILSFFFLIKNNFSVIRDDLDLLDTLVRDMKLDLPNSIHSLLKIELDNLKTSIQENRERVTQLSDRMNDDKVNNIGGFKELTIYIKESEKLFNKLEARIIEIEKKNNENSTEIAVQVTNIKRIENDSKRRHEG